MTALEKTDPKVFEIIQCERERQEFRLELIASENFASPAVMEAQGSILTNKYAEGYPGKRYYGGCLHMDDLEELARTRAAELFRCDHANGTTTFRDASKYVSFLYRYATRRHLFGHGFIPRRSFIHGTSQKFFRANLQSCSIYC